jgi:molecular chaperone DnaK
MALQRLKEACEKAKCELSARCRRDINLPFITADQSGPKHLQMTITRTKFEQLTSPLTERLPGPVRSRRQGRQAQRVHDRRGGAGRRLDAYPGCRRWSRNSSARSLNKSMNPDEVVASAPPSRAACWPGDKSRTCCCSTSPRCRWASRPRRRDDQADRANTTIPTRKKRDFSTAADNQTR